MLKKIWMPFLFLFLFFVWTNAAEAGFGVSPPRIKNQQLTPGSTYRQQIMLLRSSSDEELKATVKINAPEIESWIEIDRGSEFILPKGELQVPMIVTFKIPKNAELGNYTGSINVKILPAADRPAGVAIALGARIDIDLSLTNVSSANFLVRLISIPDFEKLGRPWNLKIWSALFDKLFYKIKVVMNIENTGNVKTAPSQVTIEIYDLAKKNILASGADKSLKKVPPFSQGQVIAEFPTKLSAGQYWAKIRIYKEQEIVNFYEIAFTIASPGVLGGSAQSLGVWPWLAAGALILTAVIIIFFLFKIRFWRFFIWLILLPTKPVWRQFRTWLSALNRRFWQWVNKEAEKHKKDDV
jgi:hypothetical protein